nr:3-oxoacyl-ACP reductase family protein [Kibdelosporangium sp. MJ126-NF4]CEL17430.1 3-oxoacyl-[acyl-carrier protein] reductase [Kibdelosporangium sp. MJ126-NF4]CTQ91343.1 3-oxoacyl-[acyl-carrier protein] reductase (EC 1.1.1.100) [Kibdelosporangium sp. MJ126-NF4]
MSLAREGLHGKIALVTGGSRGIGAATCRALAAAGARVVVNYRESKDAAADLADEIGGIEIMADVADHDQVQAMVDQVLADLGGLDILVNNAGIAHDSLIYDMRPGDWSRVMATNFGGVFNATSAVLPHFMARGAGVIVNVSSVMGERGWIGQANYAASKGAINAFTRACAMETARFGIRVNAVLPGFCPTDLVGALPEKDIHKQIPMRALADPEQVASVIRFLAGPGAGYVTGSLVTVDGGAMTALGLGRAR